MPGRSSDPTARRRNWWNTGEGLLATHRIGLIRAHTETRRLSGSRTTWPGEESNLACRRGEDPSDRPTLFGQFPCTTGHDVAGRWRLVLRTTTHSIELRSRVAYRQSSDVAHNRARASCPDHQGRLARTSPAAGPGRRSDSATLPAGRHIGASSSLKGQDGGVVGIREQMELRGGNAAVGRAFP